MIRRELHKHRAANCFEARLEFALANQPKEVAPYKIGQRSKQKDVALARLQLFRSEPHKARRFASAAHPEGSRGDAVELSTVSLA
jgi:hypothetical protein